MFKNDEKVELLLSVDKKLDRIISLLKSNKLKAISKKGDN